MQGLLKFQKLESFSLKQHCQDMKIIIIVTNVSTQEKIALRFY